MSKNKAIKVVTAAVIAGSAITAVAPAQSEAATNSVDKAITKAHNQINKAFNAYYKEARFDNKLTSTSQIRKEAKLARDYYEAAKKQIAKNGGSKSKKAAYTKKLDTKKQSLTRVENYVKAINVNIAAKKVAFEAAVKGGTQSKVLAAQTALDQKNAEFKKAVAKVFGPDARRLLTAKYYTPAEKLSATVDNEMAVYKAYRDIERKDLIEKDLAAAEKLIASTEKYVAKIEKKNTKLAKNLMKAVNKNKAAYEKAKAGTVTSQKKLDAILATAKDGDKVTIKVQATENLKIATTKALTITLTGDFKKKDLTIDAPNTHVTNKAANSGKVTINDVSNTSYEQVGSYSSLVFNDTNGGRIINSTSAPLNITIAAGAKVILVGNFGKVTVLGNAEVTLAANTVVQEVATDTAITVITEEGAKVETTTGSGTVTTQPSTPVTPPGGGGGGGGPISPALALNKIDVGVSGGGTFAANTDGKYTLSGPANAQLSSLTLEANLDGFTATIVSVDGVQVNKSYTEPTTDSNTSLTVNPNQFLPVPLQDGLSLGKLKSFLGEEVIIELKLTKGSEVVTKTITIDIEVVGEDPNDWFQFKRSTGGNLEVELKNKSAKITDMYDYTQTNEQQFLDTLMLGISAYIDPTSAGVKLRDTDGTTYKDLSAYSSTEIKNLLGISSNTTFGELVNTTLYAKVNGTERTITFK